MACAACPACLDQRAGQGDEAQLARRGAEGAAHILQLGRWVGGEAARSRFHTSEARRYRRFSSWQHAASAQSSLCHRHVGRTDSLVQRSCTSVRRHGAQLHSLTWLPPLRPSNHSSGAPCTAPAASARCSAPARQPHSRALWCGRAGHRACGACLHEGWWLGEMRCNEGMLASMAWSGQMPCTLTNKAPAPSRI